MVIKLSYLSDKKFKSQMQEIKMDNLSKERKLKLKEEKNKYKRKFKLPSTSKLILLGAILLCLQIVLFCEYVMITLGDTSAMYVLIGIPATLLAFLPNNKPIQGRFMFNVLKNALPGALAVLFNAVIIYFAAFYASDYISITNIPTMITIATAVTCLLVLLRVFLPINGFKILLFVAINA